MFIAALFIVPRTWKLPRCPSVDVLINYGTYKQGISSPLKRNEGSSHGNTWRNHKCVLLRSPSEKVVYFVMPTMWHSGKSKMDSKKISGCRKVWPGLEWMGGAQRIFRAVKLLWMKLCRRILVIVQISNIKCTLPTMNPTVTSGLCVIMMHQCRFIGRNKRATVVGCGWHSENEGSSASEKGQKGSPYTGLLILLWT